MGAVELFNHPLVAAALLAMAFLGLAAEVRSEGFRRAGWAGLLALGLFAASHLVAGTSAWTVLPLVVGVGVLWPALSDPGRRLSTALGVFLVAGGAYTVMVGPGPARLDHARALAVLLAASFVVMLVAAVVWSRLPAAVRPARRTGVFFFVPAEDAAAAREPRLVGERGTAASPLRPGGWALVHGERLEAVTEGEWIAEGDVVEVVGQEGVHLLVRGVGGSTPAGSGDILEAPHPSS